MGSTGAGTGRGAAGGGTAGANRAFPQGGMNTRETVRGQRARNRYARNAAAAGATSRVSDEDFIRATGVNPRTGRRVRRRP